MIVLRQEFGPNWRVKKVDDRWIVQSFSHITKGNEKWRNRRSFSTLRDACEWILTTQYKSQDTMVTVDQYVDAIEKIRQKSKEIESEVLSEGDSEALAS